MALHTPPLATYRIQFNHQFRFNDLIGMIAYFQDLGISHIYSSPLFKAKKGSMHGYDVTDYAQLNPEIGTIEEFEKLVNSLHSHSIGIIADIVPNHMYVGNNENFWWNSVLENGLNSPFASFFDIEWHPPKRIFDRKIFLPLLDKPFGETLESQRIKLCYANGIFFLLLDNVRLPTNPKSWHQILEPLCQEMEKLHGNSKSINQLKTLNDLSMNGVISEDMESFFRLHNDFLEHLEKQLMVFNGIKGNPLSFNSLETFLENQHYRLCYWKVANEEINYRRFFDIFELASIRIDNHQTFQEVHRLLFEMIKKKWIDGLRIDHIDGLWNPLKYLEDLKKETNSTYTIAEKILICNEKLPETWPLEGTVGYDFLNQVNGVFVAKENKQIFLDIYKRFTGEIKSTIDLNYESKKLVLKNLLASELNLLTIRLNGIAEKHRLFQDFPFNSLKEALLEIISCFPVYRTYSQKITGVIPDEEKSIKTAFNLAQKRNSFLDRTIFEFIQNLLFFKYPDGADNSFKEACNDFVMHFQQVTGPVMAKGIEDTALYRYYPLSSLNEVGGDLESFGMSVENFHKKNLERFAVWPNSMITTTTHDSKRSEDVRARINVLSEIPEEWNDFLNEASINNKKHKRLLDETYIPSRNEEYLLYQTILGTLPLEGFDMHYIKRIQDFMKKAIKEAKINSSWINPNDAYSNDVDHFIQEIFSDPFFLNLTKQLAKKIANCGMLNSLSQLILKMLSPGIPDIYQGNEIWNFRLVDPDNRSPVDYHAIREKSAKIDNLDEILKSPQDGRIKLFFTKVLLNLRQKMPLVFSKGAYIPLQIEAKKNQDHLIAFLRTYEHQSVIVLTTRFFNTFTYEVKQKENFWSDVSISLPIEITELEFQNVFTQQKFASMDNLDLEMMFSTMPFAVLRTL